MESIGIRPGVPTLGITFFVHGWVKFQSGIGNIAGWFESMGLPGFLAYAVATIELVGGLALIAGLGTRGWEFDLALMVMALHLTLNPNTALS